MTPPTAPRKAEGRNRYETLRIERGWPTPISMRRAADGIDALAIPRFGDVLRWFADLCDAGVAIEQAEAAPGLREGSAFESGVNEWLVR